MEIGENSVKISELNRTDSVCDDDLFMFSMDVETHRSISSHGTTATDMFEDIFRCISSQVSVGTMAYQSKYDYSRSDHTHDYSNVRVASFATGEKIGTVTISDDISSYQYDIRKYDYSIPPDPIVRVGTVRIIYGPTKSRSQILQDIQDGEFDGWVHPDGHSYPKTTQTYDFSEAYAVFGGQDDTFSVPVLSDFFRLVTGDGVPCGHFVQQVGILDHVHSMQYVTLKLEDEFKQKIDVPFYVTENGGVLSSNAMSRSPGKTESTQKNTNISSDGRELHLGLSEPVRIGNDEPMGKTHPTHNVLPSMIYIGKERVVSQS